MNRLRIKGAELAVTVTLSEGRHRGGRDGGGGGARVRGSGSEYK